MKFSYQNLKYAAKHGEQIGKWKGASVFSCSIDDLKHQGSGAYLVIYDDDNTIVGKNGTTWYSYGKVSESGQVTEWDHKKKYGSYHYDTQTYEAPAAASAAAVVSATVASAANVCGKKEECDAAHEVVVGDVKLGLDVDATLKAAREMTVDLLLEGFNYGL